jgi:hypothetical protein
MTCILVTSEHDMDEAIKYTVGLAKNIQGKKRLGLSFPSDGLSHIFLSNLAVSFIEEGLPIKSNLFLDIFIPTAEDLKVDDGMDSDMIEDEEWDYDSLFDEDDED